MRHEGARGDGAGQTRLQRPQSLTFHVLEGDARFGPQLPAREAGAELGLTFIDLQRTVLADHVRGLRARQHGVKCGRGQAHQLRLGLQARAVGRRPAGQTKAPQPGHHLQRVARADGEWPQRVEQPARRLPQDARRGQRQDVGKRQRAGVLGAGFQGNAFAVDQQHRAALGHQVHRHRQADDAGAHHRHIGAGGLSGVG
ncbi:hypothetical protein FQZ97_1000880 [compost metagenome]